MLMRMMGDDKIRSLYDNHNNHNWHLLSGRTNLKYSVRFCTVASKHQPEECHYSQRRTDQKKITHKTNRQTSRKEWQRGVTKIYWAIEFLNIILHFWWCDGVEIFLLSNFMMKLDDSGQCVWLSAVILFTKANGARSAIQAWGEVWRE